MMTIRYNSIDKPTIGFVADGIHCRKEKVTRVRVINLATGEEIVNRTIGNRTKTIGKFLAIVEAVKYILRHPEAPRIIYSDNLVAISWYHNKRTTLYQSDAEVDVAIIFLKVMCAKTRDIEVRCWDNRKWGDISETLARSSIYHTIVLKLL